MQAEQPETAATLFDDRQWRAAAEYRSGDYSSSVANLSGLDTADANYNRGNALARSGDLEAAIQAYDRALELDPGDEDATYNRDLVEQLLEQQQQSQQQNQNEQSQGQENSDSGDQQQGNDSESEQQQGQNGEQQRNAENQENQGQQQDDAEANGEQSDQDQDERKAQNEQDSQGSESEQQDQQQAALAPEDVEQWASDQAADQWLRRIPQDPGGLLRRKFLYQYQRLGVDQDGNYVWPGDEAHPW